MFPNLVRKYTWTLGEVLSNLVDIVLHCLVLLLEQLSANGPGLEPIFLSKRPSDLYLPNPYAVEEYRVFTIERNERLQDAGF